MNAPADAWAGGAAEPTRPSSAPLNRKRAETLAARDGLAALVVVRPQNVFYVTGHAGVLYPFSGMAVGSAAIYRPGSERATLVLSAGARYSVSDQGTSDLDFRFFGPEMAPHDPGGPSSDPVVVGIRAATSDPQADRAETPADAVASVLRAELGPSAPVGFDDPSFGAEVVAAAGAAWRIQPAHALLREIRAVKTPPEVDRLEAALAADEHAIRDVAERLRPDASWGQLVDTFRRGFAGRGGRPLYEVCGFGSRALANFADGGGPARPGEPVFFDGGGTLDRYWADTGRTMLLGEPRGRLADVARIEAEGLAAVEEATRPGRPAAEVAEAFRSVATRNGLPDGNWFWGHGIGLDIYELPRVRSDSTDVLEEGMVFNFEAPFREVGLGGVHVEDTFVVESSGCRRLSTLPRGLLVGPDVGAGQPLNTERRPR